MAKMEMTQIRNTQETFSGQYATFYLHGHYFGVDVLRVQEVIRAQVMTQVPLAPAVVRGLINLRGQIVTVIDLRRRLGLPDRASDAAAINVVVRTDDGTVSLLVDEIGDVLEMSQTAFEPPPENIRGVARELTMGVYKLKDKLLIALNMDRVVHFGESA